MNLSNARVLIAAQYAAPYEGNFIPSLKALQHELMSKFNAQCAFVFPAPMRQQPWAEKFISENKVYLTGCADTPVSSVEADAVISEFKPDLIHTHFEGYDTALFNAARKLTKPVRIVWHMHDALVYLSNPLKAAYQFFCYFRHYGIPFCHKTGVKPCIIGVCNHEPDFVRKFRLGIKTNERVIPNGINIERIDPSRKQTHETFTFLAFAGRHMQKRVDILLLAADSLVKAGYKLKVVVVDGQTPTAAEKLFTEHPEWLTVIKPNEDINTIFALADCFVSTSVHETFSYAIAEAALFGLPVIQSDIDGTMWNASNPSAFLFKSECVEDLKRAMLNVMTTSSEKLSKKCAATTANIIKGYSLEAWSEKVVSFFESIP